MVSCVLCIFFGLVLNALPVTPRDQYKNVIDKETLQTIHRKAKFMAGLLKSKEAIEETLFNEMVATHLSERRLARCRLNAADARIRARTNGIQNPTNRIQTLTYRIQTLKNEKTKLEKEKYVVLAGTLIEKLGHKYGGKLENATRREEWLYILENCKKEKPVQFITQKIREVGLTNDEFVAIIIAICKCRNYEIQNKMLECSFSKIRLKLPIDVQECILWCAETLFEAYYILRHPTTVITTTRTSTAVD